MRNKMCVSIVIPIYNVASYLSKCLDSLYEQTDDLTEVILVNDGSTDNSLDICKQYCNKYPNTIIIEKKNGGLSDARNAGTAVATGVYIYYLDSDDWLAPNAIMTLYDFAIENQCEVVQGGFYYAYEDHLLYDNRYKQPFVLERYEAMRELIRNDYVKNFAWGKLYRADIVKRHLFPKGKFYEDAYWQHHIMHETNRYGIVPTPLYYYRQRNTGISGTFSIKNLDLLIGYEERLKFVEINYPEYINEMTSLIWNLSYSFVELANKYCDAETIQAYKIFWKSLNKVHQEVFEKTLHKDPHFRLWKLCPQFLRLYQLYERVMSRIVDTNTYLKIDIK